MTKLLKKRIIFVLVLLFFLIIYLIPKKTVKPVENSLYIKNPHEIVKSDSLRVGIEKINNPLNPLFDGGNNISIVTNLIHTKLFTRDKNNEVKLEAAKEYWYENDGKTIAVVLNKSMPFQDGKEIKANDVYNTYIVLADPSYSGKYTAFVDKLDGYYEYKSGIRKDFAGIEVLGNYFIKFHFRNPDFSNIKNLIFPILDIDENLIEYGNVKSLETKEFTNVSGRYKVLDYTTDKITLEKRDIDQNSNIKVKKMEISLLKLFDAISQYKRGDLDIVYKFQNSQLLENDDLNRFSNYSYTIKHQSNMYYFIGFNTSKSIFSDKDLRKALKSNLKINELIDNKMGKGVYNYPEIPVYSNSWFNNWEKKSDNKNSLSNIIQEKNKMSMMEYNLSLDLIVQEDNTMFNLLEDEFIGLFAKEGIELNIKKLPSDKMYRALNEEKGYDIYVSQHFMREIPESFDDYLNLKDKKSKLSNKINNRFMYLLEKVKEDVNSSEIQDLAKLWTENFDENIPYIVLANENIVTIVNNNIKNLYLNEFVGLDYISNLVEIDY